MEAITGLGMGLGLAGVTGFRARYPLIILGLLTRYSETVFLREPFRLFGNTFVLIGLAGLVILDYFASENAEGAVGYSVSKLILRILSGAVLFTGLLGEFSILWGMVLGGTVALVSYFVERKFLTVEFNEKALDVIAFAATIFLIVLPLTAYLIWAGLIVILIKNRAQYPELNRRYRNLR